MYNFQVTHVAYYVSFKSDICVYCFPVDIDECAEGAHVCDSNAICNNTIGSHNCTCTVGYSGNGSSCSKCINKLTSLFKTSVVKTFLLKC